jgi:hypothetical protein
MQLRCLSLLGIFGFNLLFNVLSAQDSATAALPVTRAIQNYTNIIGENSHLFNGSEHAAYDFRIKGDPYFESSTLQSGSIKYDGILFPKVDMAFDIVRDEVTINRFNENYRMTLVSEKITFFSLFNHYFVRIVQDNKDSTNKSLVSTGFYDRVYNGNTKFFVKRQKKMNESITAEEGDKLWFEEKDLYFIEKNNKYYLINGKRELMDIFKEKKKDLKKYLRKNKIKFDDPEKAILKSVEYYDQLKS